MTDASGVTPASDEMVAGWEDRHVAMVATWLDGSHATICRDDWADWPCPTAQLLARLREAEDGYARAIRALASPDGTHALVPLPGGFVDEQGKMWPTCATCGKTHRAPDGTTEGE